MQTFLPFSDFSASAWCLDRRRLGKQRVETLQIMTALMTGKGWVSHPATLMWRRYEYALLQYQEACCIEWTEKRGYKDTCLEQTKEVYYKNRRWAEEKLTPHWLGDIVFHTSHRSNLLRKDPEYYAQYFPWISNHLDYVWPKPEAEYRRLQRPLSR